MNEKNIRLACWDCDRDDMDGITRAELLAAIKAGWQDIERRQTYEQACKTYDDPDDAPPGYSVLDWWTHLGLCPDCFADRDRTEKRDNHD